MGLLMMMMMAGKMLIVDGWLSLWNMEDNIFLLGYVTISWIITKLSSNASDDQGLRKGGVRESRTGIASVTDRRTRSAGIAYSIKLMKVFDLVFKQS